MLITITINQQNYTYILRMFSVIQLLTDQCGVLPAPPTFICKFKHLGTFVTDYFVGVIRSGGEVGSISTSSYPLQAICDTLNSADINIISGSDW